VRSILVIALVIVAGLSSLAAATDGFNAWTSESARRLAVLASPRLLPDIELENIHGERFSLRFLAKERVIVDFFYAGCDTFCVTLGNSMFRLQEAMKERDHVRFLSISFDPRDDRKRLAHYAARLRADSERWTVARPVHREDMPRVLEAFGINVIPDNLGGYVHNAALHLVLPGNRLAFIADYDKPEKVLERLEAIE
jgi:protein SCO1/2